VAKRRPRTSERIRQKEAAVQLPARYREMQKITPRGVQSRQLGQRTGQNIEGSAQALPEKNKAQLPSTNFHRKCYKM